MRQHLYIKIVISFFTMLLLSSCVGGASELKRSSSNKLFDASGFHSNKRRPLYNKKYISKAKKNIRDMDYDDLDEDEEEYESLSPSARNMQMYEKMAKLDKKRRAKSQKRYHDDFYEDDIIESRRRMSDIDESESRQDLEKEIIEIKELLRKTKDEVTKSKCPYSSKNSQDTDLSANEKMAKPKIQNKKQIRSRELEEELKDVEVEKKHKEEHKYPVKRKLMPVAEPGAMSHIKD